MRWGRTGTTCRDTEHLGDVLVLCGVPIILACIGAYRRREYTRSRADLTATSILYWTDGEYKRTAATYCPGGSLQILPGSSCWVNEREPPAAHGANPIYVLFKTLQYVCLEDDALGDLATPK